MPNIKKFGNKPEYFALILFVAAYCLIAVFHEPWFDEAQAWQIAKCSNLREMLFVLPHYEGHPPLWWMLLAIPAKLGVPFEIGLKTIGLLISGTSAALLIFRSRLPRIVRLLLPFSYFFFYQYGVIVRPYCLMLLCLLLLGMCLPRRKERPWQVFGLLLLLCLTSAYGILLAGGISICIVWEIFREKGMKALVRELLTDPRTQSLLILLVAALLLIAEIMPKSDTYVPSENAANPFWLCLLCALLTFPGECFLTFSSWFSIDTLLLQCVTIPAGELAAFCLIGIVLWLVLISAGSREGLKFLLVPYILFAVFSAKVHFSSHHLGIVFMFILFWAEFTSRDTSRFEIGIALRNRLAGSEHDQKLLRWVYLLVCGSCIVIPLVWTLCAAVNDIRLEYSYGRRASAFLTEHSLTDLNIISAWKTGGSLLKQAEGHDDYINPYLLGTPVVINAYFQENICENLNFGEDSQAFVYFKMPTYSQSRAVVKQWEENGIPDVILGKPDLSEVYGDRITYDDYALVEKLDINYTWKMKIREGSFPVFVRKELMEAHNLQPLADESYSLIVNGLQITDEMREAYENGVPIDDVLKPYLDVMLGTDQ